VDLGGVRIQVIHDLAQLGGKAPEAGVRVMVSGHSHVPAMAERAGLLYVNPGSAGPRRFRLPISIGELRVEGGEVTARLVELELFA
jgi:predicted phosphodiesterase